MPDAVHEVRARDANQTVSSLSGGNQQKVMIGRWLASGVDVLLIEEPTRGVDVGAKSEIYKLLREFADEGGAVLITSSELTEHLGLCDRILVMRENRDRRGTDGDEASEECHAACVDGQRALRGDGVSGRRVRCFGRSGSASSRLACPCSCSHSLAGRARFLSRAEHRQCEQPDHGAGRSSRSGS